jgi:uncharacterized membrane protein YcjF (UPF0283 family)
MEAMVGTLAGLIVAAIVVYIGKSAYSLYQLNHATMTVADELKAAQNQAKNRGERCSVIFDATRAKFGVDRNGNGRLDNIEAEELPDGITLSEDAIVTFAKSGELVPNSRQPRITISNSKEARSVGVSSLGSIEIKELD